MESYIGIESDKTRRFSEKQNNTKLCWATCINMVLKYHNIVNYSQEKIVSMAFKKDQLGNSPNKGANISTIEKVLKKCLENEGMQDKIIVAPLQSKIDEVTIPQSLNRKDIIILDVNISESDSEGHAVVVIGVCYNKENINYNLPPELVIVQDPLLDPADKTHQGRRQYKWDEFKKIAGKYIVIHSEYPDTI